MTSGSEQQPNFAAETMKRRLRWVDVKLVKLQVTNQTWEIKLLGFDRHTVKDTEGVSTFKKNNTK